MTAPTTTPATPLAVAEPGRAGPTTPPVLEPPRPTTAGSDPLRPKGMAGPERGRPTTVAAALGSVRSTRMAAPAAGRRPARPRVTGPPRPAPSAGADRPAGTDRRAWAVILPRPE